MEGGRPTDIKVSPTGCALLSCVTYSRDISRIPGCMDILMAVFYFRTGSVHSQWLCAAHPVTDAGGFNHLFNEELQMSSHFFLQSSIANVRMSLFLWNYTPLCSSPELETEMVSSILRIFHHTTNSVWYVSNNTVRWHDRQQNRQECNVLLQGVTIPASLPVAPVQARPTVASPTAAPHGPKCRSTGQ